LLRIIIGKSPRTLAENYGWSQTAVESNENFLKFSEVQEYSRNSRGWYSLRCHAGRI